MKYLEQKDKSMCDKAKMVIRDCAKKNKMGDPNYTSLSASMQIHLKRLVGSVYWKKAEDYLSQFLKQQFLKKDPGLSHEQAGVKASTMAKQAAAPLPTTIVSSPPSNQPHSSQSHQQKLQQQQQHAAQQRQMREKEHKRQMELMKIKEKNLKKQKRENDARKKAVEQQQQQQAQLQRPPQQPLVVPPVVSGTPTFVGKLPDSKNRTGKKGIPSRPKPTSITPGKVELPGLPTLQGANMVGGVSTAQLKEYSELMNMLDHATEFDATSAILISGRGASAGVLNLEEEQKELLYGTNGKKNETAKGLYGSGTPVVPTSTTSASGDTAGIIEGSESKLPPHLKGWSDRNLVSSRTAWAKLRLMEREEAKRQEIHLPTRDPIRSEEGDEIPPPPTSTETPPISASSSNSEWNWYNEETAEEDQALALVSEATQLYVKTLLEGAMNMSRQRMNLDGIRLWHIQQAAAAMNGAGASGANGHVVSLGGLSQASRRPPLSLRLGCDVSRQHALTQGNAAKVCQRMEEALLRKRNVGNERRGLDDSLTLSEADSMDAVAKVPKLKAAASRADYNAKRSFEVYGGKESGDPPLGRVPKQARILKDDFKVCLKDPAFALHRGGITTRSFV